LEPLPVSSARTGIGDDTPYRRRTVTCRAPPDETFWNARYPPTHVAQLQLLPAILLDICVDTVQNRPETSQEAIGRTELIERTGQSSVHDGKIVHHFRGEHSSLKIRHIFM